MADAALESAGRRVSLTEPRPESARAQNVYLEAPLPSCPAPHLQHHLQHQPHLQHHLHHDHLHHDLHHHDNNNKKPPAPAAPSAALSCQPKKSPPPPPPPPDSIICDECGKCRCDSCRQPRRPPSAWLCSDFCYCSVDSCVDYTSCLCCVKGLLYHCGPKEEWADDPCSCASSRWLPRWLCLGLASLFLPCLCCYCPLRACADACESGYAACTHRGCVCQRRLLESPQLSSHSTV